MSDNEFQRAILLKLDNQTELLASIAVDIAVLKNTDENLKEGNSKIMDDINNLKIKINSLEKMIFISWVVLAIMAAKMGFSFLLNLK